jgi:CRISPR/Cas system-associated endonuclease Cas3-HD
MVNNLQLLEQIRTTQIFNEAIKNQLMAYFSILTPGQKEIMYSALRSEKTILLNYLRSLKDDDEVQIEEIQRQTQIFMGQKRWRDESKEKATSNREVQDLLVSLNSI